MREPDLKQPPPLLTAVGRPDGIANLAHVETALFSIFGGVIKDAIRDHIMSWDAGEAAPPLVERRAELARLDAEITDLERREQALVDEARAAGIRI